MRRRQISRPSSSNYAAGYHNPYSSSPSSSSSSSSSTQTTSVLLNEKQLENIRTHKYKSTGQSLLEPIFQQLWCWVVELVPVSIAPNTLTIIGLACTVLSSISMFVCTKGGVGEAPSYVYLIAAVGLFLYQTLDAIDGKQARRTNSSSPLGELFDHGCDTLSCVILALDVFVLIQLGRDPWTMFYCFFSILAAFYFAHWQTYVTGTLNFGFLDVTEAQLGVIMTELICVFCQNSFFGMEFRIFDVVVTLRTLYVAVILLGTCRCSLENLSRITQGGIGINGSSVANSSIVSPFFQFALICLMAFTIGRKSDSHVFENNPVLYLLMFGLVWCKYTNELIVATMSKSRIHTTDSILIGPSMLLLNQYLGTIFAEYLVLVLAFLYCLYDLVKYNHKLCMELCEYLHIKCFSITPPESTNTNNN